MGDPQELDAGWFGGKSYFNWMMTGGSPFFWKLPQNPTDTIEMIEELPNHIQCHGNQTALRGSFGQSTQPIHKASGSPTLGGVQLPVEHNDMWLYVDQHPHGYIRTSTLW